MRTSSTSSARSIARCGGPRSPMRTGEGMRVLFAAAAGPRLGFGHLVRCRSLARVLGVPPRVVLRASAATRRRAVQAGWTVIDVLDDQSLQKANPQILVVDDPLAAAVRRWLRRADRT